MEIRKTDIVYSKTWEGNEIFSLKEIDNSKFERLASATKKLHDEGNEIVATYEERRVIMSDGTISLGREYKLIATCKNGVTLHELRGLFYDRGISSYILNTDGRSVAVYASLYEIVDELPNLFDEEGGEQ